MSDSLITGPLGLMDTTCHCGNNKKVRQTFCSKCYYSLPEGMRSELYRRVGCGYEEAHAAALVKLRKLGRVK